MSAVAIRIHANLSARAAYIETVVISGFQHGPAVPDVIEATIHFRQSLLWFHPPQHDFGQKKRDVNRHQRDTETQRIISDFDKTCFHAVIGLGNYFPSMLYIFRQRQSLRLLD